MKVDNATASSDIPSGSEALAAYDITLTNVVSKGGDRGSWDTPLEDLGENVATVTLPLDDSTDYTYSVIREHEGEDPVTLDATVTDGAISFDTNKFSKYTIVKTPVAKSSIEKAEITLGDALTYNGAEQTQTIASVKVDGRTLTAGTDYTVSGNTGTNVNTYTLTITGAGNYTGTATKEWTIGKKDISDAVITLGDVLTYNGREQTQTIASVKVEGKTLTEGTDYEVAGNTGTDANTYTLTITGTGNYTGTATKEWTIGKKDISDAVITLGDVLTYKGTEQTQTIAGVKVDGRILTAGTDYTVTGNTGTDVNTYTLTITGTGNYTGTANKNWSIGQKSITGATITLGDALTYNGTTQTQAVSSVAIGESTLASNTDYTISGNQQKDAGTYTLTVTGTGNYTGTVTTQFNIEKATLTPALRGTTTKVYDNTTAVTATNNLTLTVIGLMSSETVTVTATGYAYDDANAGSGKTITATGITISGDAAKNYVLSGTTAAVAGGKIDKVTPTITLSNLSETTQAPTGAKATLNLAEASAQLVIEYQVLDTPAVAATPEVPCKVTHEEGCASLTEGNTIADCNCAKAHTSHDSGCGYKAATSGSPATYKWVTTRPTTPGTYQVRAYLPTGTTNVAAIAVENAVTGSYILTQYTAPSGGGSNSGSDSGSNSGSDSGSDSDSDSDSSGSSSSGSTTTPAQAEVKTPALTENTTTRRPVPATEESNTETTSEKTIGVFSEDGAGGWTNIKTEINDKLANALEAEGGEEVVVTVEMNGEDTVPADIFENIKGQDITVTFDMGNGIVWAVNGMDVTADSFEDINFSASTGDGVTAIPVDLMSGLTEERFSMELTLEYEGEFGFAAVMSVNVDKKNAGKYANLFYFNPKAETMEFICSAPVKEDGTTDLTFTHASDYVIVVNEVAMSAANNMSMDKVEQSVPQETPSELSPVELDTAEKDAFNPLWIIVIGIVVLMIGGIAIFAIKKKKE